MQIEPIGLHRSQATAAQSAIVESALLLDPVAVSALLSISKRHLMRLVAAAAFPPAVRVGRCLRWRRKDIEDFIGCGCIMVRWHALQRGKR